MASLNMDMGDGAGAGEQSGLEIFDSLDIFEDNPSKALEEDGDFQILLTKLRENPYHFVSWYGDRPPIKQQMGKKMLEYLLQFSHRPRSRREIAEYKFSEFNSVQELVIFFVEAFLTLEIRGRHWSYATTRCVRGGKKCSEILVAQGLDTDYVQGIDYLYRWLCLHILIVKGKKPKGEETVGDYNGIQEFENLPKKSTAIVLGAKCLFLSSMRIFNMDARIQGIETLRQVVLLDPLTYEWHYQLGNWLRFIRKQPSTGFEIMNVQRPGEEEMTTLWETYDCCDYTKVSEDGKPSVLRKMALAGVCQGLAEVIRYRARNKMTGAFKFGGLELASELEAVDFVRQQIECMSTDTGTTYAELIRYGEILASILPFEYRDYKAAEKYYKAAWNIMPDNSKINHKIGCLYLTSDELRDIDFSLKFLRRAVASEKSNIPAATDLIKTLMSYLTSPSDNIDEIEKLVGFYYKRQNTGLPTIPMHQLLWLHGCAKFLTEEDKYEAVKLWISAQQHNPCDKNLFYELPSTIKRHKWDVKQLNLGKVNIALKNAMGDFPNEAQNSVLQKLFDTFPKLQPRNQDPSLRGNNRGHLRPYRPRQESESDKDGDWRRPTTSTTSDNVSDQSNQLWNQGCIRFQNKRNPGPGGRQGQTNGGPNGGDQDRSPSSQSWR